MSTPLQISREVLTSDTHMHRIFNTYGRCAIAICIKGDCDIKIMDKEYRIQRNCIIACMPFVNVEILQIREKGDIIVGSILLENVLSVINRTVNSNNLLAIQQTPVVHITDSQLKYLISSIDGYWSEIKDSEEGKVDHTCQPIHQEILEVHSRLIVAQILKLYFTNIPMEVRGANYRDIVFQHFMLDLYMNCKNNRNVKFYASRSGLSLKYFSTIVKELSGHSPSEWIETVMIGEAKAMLNNTHQNIKEIAALLNFPNASTFTKYFTRITGVTPKVYRNSIIQ